MGYTTFSDTHFSGSVESLKVADRAEDNGGDSDVLICNLGEERVGLQ